MGVLDAAIFRASGASLTFQSRLVKVLNICFASASKVMFVPLGAVLVTRLGKGPRACCTMRYSIFVEWRSVSLPLLEEWHQLPCPACPPVCQVVLDWLESFWPAVFCCATIKHQKPILGFGFPVTSGASCAPKLNTVSVYLRSASGFSLAFLPEGDVESASMDALLSHEGGRHTAPQIIQLWADLALFTQGEFPLQYRLLRPEICAAPACQQFFS